MAGTFQKLPLKKFPKAELRTDSREQKFWKQFQFPVIVKEHSAINYVQCSPVEPYDCLVTSSAKVQIFEPYTNVVKRTSTRAKENVYGARYRKDGKLMVTGGDSGMVQVLDVKSRSILRSLKGHTKPTHVCSFSQENLKVVSGSDDKTVRLWDLATESEISVLKAHKDYIRCGCVNPSSSGLFVSGSYDHTVKMWDSRLPSVAMEMSHDAPVESVVMHQNGSFCVSSGGNYLKVWDMLFGGRCIHQFSNHQKTITCLCFNGAYTRLLSGSLDRHVKVYDIQDYSLIANIDYPSPILAMDLSRNSQHLVVGMSDGAISLRHRRNITAADDQTSSRKRRQDAIPGTYWHKMRNQAAKPEKNDVVIKDEVVRRLSKADYCLKKFNHRAALDVVLGDKRASNDYIISMLSELSRRNALDKALADRDAEGLKDIMHFLVKNISNPYYAKTLVPVADIIINMYSSIVGTNKRFDYLLKKLNARIKSEMRSHETMMRLLGAMELLFTMATPVPDDDLEEDCSLSPQNDDVDFVVDK